LSLLKAIIDASPTDKETYIKPLLNRFILHPVIKEIIGKSDATEQTDANSHKSELDKIQNMSA
jgi:hypothetical protein